MEGRVGEGRMERKKRELRKKIVKVAVKLFEQRGFNNTTMEQISEEADVARKTLYNYFPVKEAIADEYVKGISQDLAQETFESMDNLPDTRSRLLAALHNAYGWVEINPELTGIVLAYRVTSMYQVSGDEVEETGTQRIIAEIIRKGQQAAEIRSDISVKQLVRFIDLLRFTMVMEWLQDTGKFELREEIARMVDMILDGISIGESQTK